MIGLQQYTNEVYLLCTVYSQGWRNLDHRKEKWAIGERIAQPRRPRTSTCYAPLGCFLSQLRSTFSKKYDFVILSA